MTLGGNDDEESASNSVEPDDDVFDEHHVLQFDSDKLVPTGTATAKGGINRGRLREVSLSLQQRDELKRKKKWRAKLNMILMALVSMGFGIEYSIVSPFFPQEAERKGMSPTVIGIVFSIYELVNFITSPIFGILTPRLGPKFMIFWGMVMSGAGTALFGVLQWCPAGASYDTLCILCRLIAGLGSSMYLTASFALAGALFPDNASFVYGILEAVNGIGFMIGPAIGGWLFAVGGFALPFLSLGAVIIALGIGTTLSIETAAVSSTKLLSPVKLFKQFKIILLCSLYVVMNTFYGFMQPTYAIRLTELGIESTITLGLLFLAGSAVYAVSTLIVGNVIDRVGFPVVFIILSMLLQGFGYSLCGSALLFKWVTQTWVTLFIGDCIVNMFYMGYVLAIVPVLEEGCVLAGYDDHDLTVKATVAGIYNSLWFLGAFLGPMISGPLLDVLNYEQVMAAFSLIIFFNVAIVTGYSVIVRLLSRHKVPSLLDNLSSTPQVDYVTIN